MYQIFALDSAVVEVQEMFSSHGGHLTNAACFHSGCGGFIISESVKYVTYMYFEDQTVIHV